MQLGRRHQRGLAPGLDCHEHREEGDDRLAASDIALNEAQHPLRLCQIRDDVGDRALLRAGEREGQSGQRLGPQPAIAGHGLAGLAPLMPAHEQQGELTREQFVLGETPARDSIGCEIADLLGRV